MARTAGIGGRAPPPRKRAPASASTSPIPKRPTSSPSARASLTGITPGSAVTKAAKRSAKRAELLSQVSTSSASASTGADAGARTLSKSALRRAKKRVKEQLAGNQAGLGDVEAAIGDVEEEMEDEQAAREREGEVDHRLGASMGGKGAITAKARKRVLATEQARQTHIISDPAYASNPFAALRAHARNTLAFDRPPATSPARDARSGAGKDAMEVER